MYAEERQKAIAEWIAHNRRAAVSDLATRFDVTTETVRRDLDRLEGGGMIRRVHGGAVAPSSLAVMELGFVERQDRHAAQKDDIATAALQLVPAPGGSMIFDGGTTTGRLGAILPTDRELTVLTNAVPLAARLAGQGNISLRLIGGQVRGVTHTAVGETATAALASVRVDVVFMGANGITNEFGASTPDAAEAGTKRAMIRAGRQVVVLADSSKFGEEHLHSFAACDQIDVVVTDAGADPTWVAALEAAGVRVVVA